MTKNFKLIFFGAGTNQISYVKSSFFKKNYNIVIHNKPDTKALKYSDQFFLGSVYDKKKVLNICKKIKKHFIVNDIVCRSTGPSVISAAAAFKFFKINRVNNELAKCIYSKYYFHKFLKKKNIPSLQSKLIKKNRSIYPKGKWVLKPDCPIYGKLFIFKIENRKLSNNNFKLVKKNSDNKKGNLSKYIPGLDVSVIFFIEKRSKKKILLNIINEWNFFLKNKMDIYNYKSVPGLSTPEILITSSERKKILQYSKKILASFPDYYGLISISYRVNENKVYAYEININIEKRYTNIIFPSFHDKYSLYDIEVSNLMGTEIPKIEYNKKKKFVGILNNKKIVNKKEYLKKIKKYLDKN